MTKLGCSQCYGEHLPNCSIGAALKEAETVDDLKAYIKRLYDIADEWRDCWCGECSKCVDHRKLCHELQREKLIEESQVS